MPREEERTEGGVEAITSSSFALWHDLKYRSGQDETRGEREREREVSNLSNAESIFYGLAS